MESLRSEENRRKKILFLSHSASLYGFERYLLDLLKGLDKNKYQPIVIISLYGPLRQENERCLV